MPPDDAISQHPRTEARSIGARLTDDRNTANEATAKEDPVRLSYDQAAARPQKFPGRKFEAVPSGTYRLLVLDIEPRTPKNGGVDYLSVTFEVEAGEYLGRRLWDSFFLEHANEGARDVSRWRFDEVATPQPVSRTLRFP
jgi:hypothetical protein